MQKTIHLSYPGPEDNNSIIFLSLTVPEDIEGLMYSTKTNKASFPNSIPPSTFQLFQKEFSKPLSDIINMFQSRCISRYTKNSNCYPFSQKW